MTHVTASPSSLAPLTVAVLVGLYPSLARAELGQAQSDFGGVGLMQTPTARMAPLGEFSFTYGRVEPYTRYNISVQPLDWFEVGFRYTEIDNRFYGPSIAGDRDYLDKGIDFKLGVWDESRYLPQVALGFRDFGGTGLFSGEYLVASKRWYDLDFSLGVGTGYLGAGGDIDNPLGWVDDRFDTRGPGAQSIDDTGDFSLSSLFSGPIGFFGGVEYQTPWDPLTLQLEYDGNDYQSEPLNNRFEQDSSFNLGARYRLNDNLKLNLGWERGNTLMAGMTLSANLAGLSQIKRDPQPVPLQAPATDMPKDWRPVVAQLGSNAGTQVKRIRRDGDTLIVDARPTKYRSLAETEARANRILHNATPHDIDTYRYRWYSRGLPVREDVQPRHAYVAAAQDASTEVDYKYSLYSLAATESHQGDTLYEGDPQRFGWRIGPGINQNLGGPDGYLYEIYLRASAEYHTDANGWFSGMLGWTVADNFESFDYIASSDLPRVRTYIGEYLAETDLGLYNLQYTRTAQLDEDWYAMAYGGLLESMYAGVGGEVLYRPFNSHVAYGLDLNWVRQRDFDQRFGLRDYDTWTGHATAYVEPGWEDILAQVSVGRYLAGDIGATFDVSREFENGARIGAWATLTDAGDDYGEGSFDKGIYITLPLDAFFTTSSRAYTSVAWKPLTRDGGARLARQYSLYGLTHERDMGRYWDEIGDALE
ncbi:YjbH domain-containing protein [Modicisalibacter xianhensis]|uniref:Exopolysaccharide biosynthesis protein YbjH n=1 Tax=Modicisalibacter xianhensis TaxID=442341 RepID=A0A1I2ZC36_9GAMM|nr:YjbH domain-containing protein [Halomonas xianhensis]SFH35260.1 Exopolysaccharide biosynthesis protein YbjH [Halomonas xianhensis]